MKKFLHKAKASFQDSGFPSQQQQPIRKQGDSPSTIQPPSPIDVLRYRYNHGANLGSVFVLEQWLTGSMFVEGAKGGSELDAVTASIKKDGLDATKAKWRQHWDNALTDSDLDFLVNEAHCTALRLPIGYFTLGPQFTNGTPFAGTPSEVYREAWPAVQNLVTKARSRGIGVLLDLHALPGGANGDAHSGSSTGKAELWKHRSNLQRATDCTVFVAEQARGMDGVVGLQLVNEAAWAADGMYAWYDSTIAAVAHVHPGLPVYISDAWNLQDAVAYARRKNAPWGGLTCPVFVDTHKYWCFADKDKARPPQAIVDSVRGELGELDGNSGNVFDGGATEVIIGEYSCVLDGQTWDKSGGADRGQLVRQFGQAQSQKWQERAAGSYFWTLKMDWLPGGEWGFIEQTRSGALPPPASLLLPTPEVHSRAAAATSQRDSLRGQATSGHRSYWDGAAPGQPFEHDRFDAGWDVGFSDALAFFKMRAEGGLGGGVGDGGDRIGALDAWVRRRMEESGQGGGFVWEWEQGFRQGVKAFYQAVGL